MTDSNPNPVLRFFRSDATPSPMPAPGDPPYGMLQIEYQSDADRPIFEAAAPSFLSATKTAFVGFEDSPLNITILEFDPGFILPLHSHRSECLYYVERGTILMGNKVLGPGEGFLSRADQPYGYRVGPEGARVLEFRHGFTLDFTLCERNVAAWKARFERSVGTEGAQDE